MAFQDALLPEFDFEMAATRRTLERLPDDKLDWKPHPRSLALGELATHIAQIPHWVAFTMQQDSLEMQPASAPSPRAEPKRSRADVLAAFDRHVAAARAAIASAEESRFRERWSLLKGGKAVFTLPRSAALRSFILNHTIHHRAQLGVYLRMLDLPVPSIYGPSADEGTS
jgi:uncharacterized damage-inducible protein DinB